MDTYERNLKIVKLHAEGMTKSELAQRFGVTFNIIRDVLVKHGTGAAYPRLGKRPRCRSPQGQFNRHKWDIPKDQRATAREASVSPLTRYVCIRCKARRFGDTGPTETIEQQREQVMV